MFDAKEISQMLARDAERVASYLLPNGRRQSREWCIGSIHGEPGESLKVHLEGNKSGLWADFASGEKGDLLDLWKATQNLSTIGDAIKQAREFLCLQKPRFEPLPSKEYTPYLTSHLVGFHRGLCLNT